MAKQQEILTAAEAAEELGVTIRRVQAMATAGRLPGARKFGRDWMIPRAALAAVKDRKPGRPRKDDA